MNWKTIILILFALLIPICLANPLPYWIEDLPNGSYNIWTKLNISAGGTVYVVIQKEPGYHPNGDEVFLAFDDFDGSELDTNKWMRIDLYHSGLDSTNYHAIIEDSTLNIGENGDTDGLVFKKQFSGNLVVETKIELDTTTDNIQGGIVFFANNDRSAYVYRIRNTQQNPGWYQLIYMTGTTGHNLITLNYNTYKKRWEILKLVYHDSTFVLYSDNNLIGTAEDSHLKSGYIGLWYGYNSNGKDGAHYDWIFVRKYAPKDPIVNVIFKNSTSMIVKIYNPNGFALTNFQVKIPSDGFVNSKTESLCVRAAPPTYINYYKSIGGYTLTVSGDLGNVTLYLGSALLYSGVITSNHPFQTTFPYDVSAYPLKIIYHDYDNISIPYPIASITQGTYTLNLVPVGNYTNETFYPMIITVAGKSYWISNYSNIPMNVSVSTYENNPILITTSLGQEISVPAKNQKVPIYFTTSWSSVKASTTPSHVLEFKTQEGYIVGYGQIINIKIPTGLTLTPYLDGFKLTPFTVCQNLNLFYSPTDLLPQINIYQTITGDILISIKSLQPHNFTALFYQNNTIVKNISLLPGTFTYPNENYTKIVIYVDGKEYATMELYPTNPLKNWDSLDFSEKVLLSSFLLGIIGIIYLVSGITMVLAAGITIPLLILLPLPTSLIGFISAFMLLSALFYLYKRRV